MRPLAARGKGCARKCDGYSSGADSQLPVACSTSPRPLSTHRATAAAPSSGVAGRLAAQRPFYFDHIAELTDRAFDEFAELTGRRYRRASGYWLDDADYVIVGQGSVVSNAEAVADCLPNKGWRWEDGRSGSPPSNLLRSAARADG